MSLGKDISKLVSRGDGEQLEISFLEMLASDVAVDLNMLSAFVEDIIMSNVDSITIVTIKRSGSGLRSIHSAKSQRSQTSSQVVSTRARYSASVLEQETTPASCCPTRQEKYLTGNRNL